MKFTLEEKVEDRSKSCLGSGNSPRNLITITTFIYLLFIIYLVYRSRNAVTRRAERAMAQEPSKFRRCAKKTARESWRGGINFQAREGKCEKSCSTCTLHANSPARTTNRDFPVFSTKAHLKFLAFSDLMSVNRQSTNDFQGKQARHNRVRTFR